MNKMEQKASTEETMESTEKTVESPEKMGESADKTDESAERKGESTKMTTEPTEKAMKSAEKTSTLLLFGKTGSGKSATGNSILGIPKKFAASPMFHTTKTYQVETFTRDDWKLRVVDTPDVTESLDHISDKDATREVAKWLVETKDGIDALLLIHKFGVRFTDQQKTLLGELEKYFGKEIYKHTIVVFTHGDQLEEAIEDGSLASIEEYVSEEWGGLPKLMKQVDKRYVVFNNKVKGGEEDKKRIEELKALVKRVTDQNNGPYKSEYVSIIVAPSSSTEPGTAEAAGSTEGNASPIPFDEQVDIVYQAMTKPPKSRLAELREWAQKKMSS